jgi:diacylglycerol kinase family enzyme
MIMASRPASSRRPFALAALAALVLLLGGLARFIVTSFGDLAKLGLGTVLDVAVLAAAGWWAFTTRRVWKRWLNLGIVALAIAGLVTQLVYLGLAHTVEVLAVAVAALAYAAATRHALRRGPALVSGHAGARAVAIRPWLLVNPRSGDGKAERLGLADVAAERGIQVRVLSPGEDPSALASQAVVEGADAVGMAGGDGSLGAVAAVAMRLNVPFVCIPTGTRNHFAHDLGLDRDKPLDALDAFTGVERRVDAGAVADRVFLNNVSLGAYADLVREPGYRARKLATAQAMLPGALRGERAPAALRVRDPNGRTHDRPLVLLVANNRYELRHPFDLGIRQRLDAGVLQVAALRVTTGARFAVLLARLAVGNYVAGARWAQWTSAKVRVDAGLDQIPAGIDGEAMLLATPLEFRALPLALRVLVPAATPAPRAAEVRPLTRAALRRVWAAAWAPRNRPRR